MKFLIPAQNFGIFASPTEGIDIFLMMKVMVRQTERTARTAITLSF